MVSGALFLPYVAYQKCKPSAKTTGAGATYNYMNQVAPAPVAVTSTDIHQEIQVGGTPAEAAPAEPHQGGCSNFWMPSNFGTPSNEIDQISPGGVFFGCLL